ncbi:hypothetical protein [Phaeacidiphilus oryzae]|uniref:hypothetical protein n=1 Tax=Phaeacidiphilus oryzae TaxID=348818 RepID=UPI00068AB55D|nr:hypothetical protein [Phaeacidiphilus oryzae]
MENAPNLQNPQQQQNLQNEDKPEFEKVLDEALHASDFTEALRRSAPGLTAEQLRTRALGAAAEIAEPAQNEYAWYVGLRDQTRADARARSTPAPDPAEPAPLPGEPLEGAGLAPVMAVLLPILAGIAAVVFLILGYLLHAADSGLAIGRGLITAGWVALAVAAVGMVLGIVGILLTAMRDGASPPDGESPQLYADLAQAKDAWRETLRRRAILPYLYDQLEEHEAAVAAAGAPDLSRPAGSTALATGPRTEGVSLTRERKRGDGEERERPRIGYSSPGFESPGAEGISGEHGETLPSPEDEPRYSSPRFASPGFDSPDFTGPDEPPGESRPGSRPESRSGARPAAEARSSSPRAANPLVHPRRPRAVPPRGED